MLQTGSCVKFRASQSRQYRHCGSCWQMNDRAKYYLELCAKAAERLGVEPTDESAEHIATLQMAREAISAKLIEGRDIDPNALLKINEALHTILPPVKPPKVEIEIIEGNFQHCPACGHTGPCGEP